MFGVNVQSTTACHDIWLICSKLPIFFPFSAQLLVCLLKVLQHAIKKVCVYFYSAKINYNERSLFVTGFPDLYESDAYLCKELCLMTPVRVLETTTSPSEDGAMSLDRVLVDSGLLSGMSRKEARETVCSILQVIHY